MVFARRSNLSEGYEAKKQSALLCWLTLECFRDHTPKAGEPLAVAKGNSIIKNRLCNYFISLYKENISVIDYPDLIHWIIRIRLLIEV